MRLLKEIDRYWSSEDCLPNVERMTLDHDGVSFKNIDEFIDVVCKLNKIA